MFRRAQRMAIAALLTLTPLAASAQVVWQPTAAPTVTAENTTWYLSGQPIEWNGDLYYPGGTPQGFNGYQMVRAGSHRGIPLYIDPTLEPNSILLVPLAGQRMQPYERLRTGQLAGTQGSRVSDFPSDIGADTTVPSGVQQAPMPPTVGTGYDSALPADESPAPARPAAPSTLLGTTSSAPSAVGTSGRSVVGRANGTISSVVPPTGLNGIWIGYDGQRWFANGKAVALRDGGFQEVGSYHGFPVYQLPGDSATIYVPTTEGRVAPYKRR